jgi:hypothetical protein
MISSFCLLSDRWLALGRPWRGWSWDFDLADARCGGALCDEERQQRESFAF